MREHEEHARNTPVEEDERKQASLASSEPLPRNAAAAKGKKRANQEPRRKALCAVHRREFADPPIVVTRCLLLPIRLLSARSEKKEFACSALCAAAQQPKSAAQLPCIQLREAGLLRWKG